jgi:hypothetical protein
MRNLALILAAPAFLLRLPGSDGSARLTTDGEKT